MGECGGDVPEACSSSREARFLRKAAKSWDCELGVGGQRKEEEEEEEEIVLV